ncbi:hypothetical protein TNCV_4444701 [Trichonephila clavipes]|nr:hypothetical protein TNCV_4444701 [Trichonephila clavipes]
MMKIKQSRLCKNWLLFQRNPSAFCCVITKTAKEQGRGSLVVKVTDLWLSCHEFEPGTTADPSVDGLIARISVTARRIRDMQGIFQNVRNSVQHRCQAC